MIEKRVNANSIAQQRALLSRSQQYKQSCRLLLTSRTLMKEVVF